MLLENTVKEILEKEILEGEKIKKMIEDLIAEILCDDKIVMQIKYLPKIDIRFELYEELTFYNKKLSNQLWGIVDKICEVIKQILDETIDAVDVWSIEDHIEEIVEDMTIEKIEDKVIEILEIEKRIT